MSLALRSSIPARLVIAAGALVATPAFAHPGHGRADSLLGVDHMIAAALIGALAVCVPSARRGARFALPTGYFFAAVAALLVVDSAGAGASGLAGAALVAVCALAAWAAWGRGSLPTALIVVVAAGAVHGAAHAGEPALAFAVESLILHVVGVVAGFALVGAVARVGDSEIAARRRRALRVCGALSAVVVVAARFFV